MADLDLYKVDLTTEQPGGRQGESPRAAFTKYNDALDAIAAAIADAGREAIGAAPPAEPYPYQPWIDTSVNPAMIRRRNATNTAWVAIMPALQALGTAAAADLTTSATDTTPGRALKVGDAGLSGPALPSPADIFSNATNEFARTWSPTTQNTPASETYGVAQSITGGGDVYDVSKWLFKLLFGTTGSIYHVYKINQQTWRGPFEMFDTRNCSVTENANGTSFRFPNGVQLCWRRYAVPETPINLANADGSFRSAQIAWSYPQSFLANGDLPFVSVSNDNTSNGVWTSSSAGTPNAGYFLFRRNASASSPANLGVSLFAVGRYK